MEPFCKAIVGTSIGYSDGTANTIIALAILMTFLSWMGWWWLQVLVVYRRLVKERSIPSDVVQSYVTNAPASQTLQGLQVQENTSILIADETVATTTETSGQEEAAPK